MKIKIYALHQGFGGVEKYVCDLANMLSVSHDVDIVFTYKKEENPAFFIDPKVKFSYLINHGPNKDTLKASIHQKNPIKIFKELVKAINIYLKRYTLNKKSIKNDNSDVIISTRIFHNKLIGKYSKSSAIKITGEHNYHNNDKKYIKKVINSVKGFNYFIPISKELTDFYRPLLEPYNIKSVYIPYGLKFDETLENSKHNTKNIVYVGRLSPEKGVMDLLKVMQKVMILDNDAKLHIIGDGTELQSMKNYVNANSMQNNVFFYGFMQKKDIEKMYKDMNVMILTSYTESFGIVLLESMACKVIPVIFDSAKGAVEILTSDNLNSFGVIIKNRDIDKMASSIVEILNNNTLSKMMGDRAKERTLMYKYENSQKIWLDFMSRIEGEING